MAFPTVTLRVDWANKGTFTGAYDTVVALSDPGLALSRGASADLGAEADGSLAFDLDNVGDRYTPDRNWADNPSFELGTTDWVTAAIAGLTAAATSIGQVTDNAPSAGTKAGEAILTATLNSGVFYRIPYPFKSGVTYAFEVYLKSVSGNLNVRCGLASEGTPADIASSGSNITTGWAAYSGTWTPSADRDDVVVFVRTTTAAAATVRIDRVQVNAGSAVNAYQEAPTRGELTPGRPVHLYATLAAVDTAKFFGHIDRITPNPETQRARVHCYDPLRRLAETDVIVPGNSYAAHSARTMRRAVLEDFERGTRNLLVNPSFETDVSNWTHSGTSLTRTATDAAPGAGSAYAAFVTAGVGSAYSYARLAPIYFEGETYRFSVYLKVASGTATCEIGLSTAVGTEADEISVTVTTAWQRFTATYTMTADQTGSGANPLVAWVTSTAAGTVRIDAAAITRGQALYPYSDTGTGRWPNWVGNGDFEGGSGASGWLNPVRNIVANPSFETDTSGWSVALDTFTAAATSITRSTSGPLYGAGRGHLTIPAVADSGAWYAIAGTFKSGVTYDFRLSVKSEAGLRSVGVGIGDGAVPTDVATLTANTDGGNWTAFTGSWTPTADRVFVRLFVREVGALGNVLHIDGAAVYRRATTSAMTRYFDTGPGGGGLAPTSIIIAANAGKYGYQSLYVTTPATADTGTIYDLNHYGPRFVSGQQYILSLWVYPSSSMPYKVGIGADKGDGTWDEASTTGTATANVWTQITRTWTPSADRDTGTPLEGVVFVYQTDATARTFRVDGVRVIPGGTADDFEMSHWDLDMNGAACEAGDRYLGTASFSGSALAALETLNDLTLTRHWIKPTMAAPWYQYVTEDRASFLTKASVATFTEDIQGWTDLDIDAEAIVNIVRVSWADGSEFYSDGDSVGRYGPYPGASIDGSAFFADRTIPDLIGSALIDRYAHQRLRPTLRVEQQYANQLLIDLNDVVTVTIAKFLLRAGQFVVLREDLLITQGGRSWVTDYRVEEYPY